MNSSDLNIIDTHCHLDFAAFDDDRQTVINQAMASGVINIVVPAVKHDTWHTTIKLCQEHSNCDLALGMHPMFIEHHQPQHLNALDEAIKQSQPIAVGEIGLDYYLPELSSPELKQKQQLFFSKQLIIANQHQLPVIIHNRKAHDQCLSLLKQHQANRGIIHAFNGSLQQAQAYIKLGFVLGFGGMVTYPRSRKLRTLVTELPLDSIVLETDAPDMSPVEHHGTRNSPEYLDEILHCIAELRNQSAEHIAKITSDNAKRILAL